jgi:hypothetical protein
MDLIINSLYSDKDIFLRELVSNAADACDKKRFLSLTSNGGDGASSAAALPQVKIRTNPDENTIIIEDSGVGMTRDELINNLGMLVASIVLACRFLFCVISSLLCTILTSMVLSCYGSNSLHLSIVTHTQQQQQQQYR